MEEFTFVNFRERNVNWEDLLLLADSDFISYIILGCHGINESTSLWISLHAVEKYLKCLLLKDNPNEPIRKYGHDVKKLLKKVCSLSYIDNNELESKYKDFLNELNRLNTNVRYSYAYDIRAMFHRYFISVCCDLRKLILGEAEYNSRGFFGLADFCFTGTVFFTETSLNTQKIVNDTICKVLLGRKIT